ncbi:MAG: hypothetical protein ACOY81_00430 [Bacillota bacterium]
MLPIESFETYNWEWVNKWLVEILAIYATIISTYALYLVFRLTRPQLKVFLSPGRETGRDESILTITALNNGRKPVTVTACGIIMPDGQKITLPCGPNKLTHPPLPARLKEGQTCDGFFYLPDYLPTLLPYGQKVILQGFFRDAEKTDHISEPVHLELPRLPENVLVLTRPQRQE